MSTQTTDLHAVLQAYLPWHKSRVMFMSAFILSLLKVMTVNWTKIANGLNGHADRRSNYRRIQRFFAHFEMDYDLLAPLMVHWLPTRSKWVLSIDRTDWQFGRFTINILMVGIVYQGVAFPLCWMLLDKKGISSTAERIQLMERVLMHLPAARIQALLGDREFIGHQWFSWLKEHHIPFGMRIRENAQMPIPTGQGPVRLLGADLAVDQQRILRKPRLIYGHPLYLSVLRLADEYVLIAAPQAGGRMLHHYQQRWGIECLFAALKSRGFDFEQTHLSDPERIEKLIGVLALAFAWAFLVGQWLAQHKPLKIKNHGRKENSLFRYGLDHLQYILLNIDDQIDAFIECLWLLMVPSQIHRS
jgi:hypothetical protein